jgi:hypothetical protein
MIPKGYQGLVAELGGGAGGDAIIREMDGSVSDGQGFQ